jgi:hypothetical protein
LTQYYEDEISALAIDKNTVDVYNLPSDISSAKASVYYTTGQGRDQQKVYLVEDASLNNGTITLSEDMDTDLVYIVYITSDNYAQITGEVSY